MGQGLMWLVVGLFAVAVIGSAVVYMSLRRLYGGMFTLEHYRVVAQALEAARRGAIENTAVDDAVCEPSVTVTDLSLAIAYSVREHETHFEHHISVSTPKAGHTVDDIGETFVAFFVWCLDLDPEACESFAGPDAYHLVFSKAGAGEDAFARRPVTLPDEAARDTIQDEIERIRERIAFSDETESISLA